MLQFFPINVHAYLALKLYNNSNDLTSAAKMSNKEFSIEFIEIYRQNSALWKIKSTDYVNKNLKKVEYCALIEVPSVSATHSSNTSINTAFITKERHTKKKQKRNEDVTEHRQLLQVCSNPLATATANKALDDKSQKVYAEILITQVLQKAVINQLSQTTIVADQREPSYFNTFWPHHQVNEPQTFLNSTTNIAPSAATCDVPPTSTSMPGTASDSQ
ncbi:hypothetical protein FQR65_LT12440 [Abscondita terminalis]|nr:hypothetical protein FQR65_LT12440 [Abscondita terminalis]